MPRSQPWTQEGYGNVERGVGGRGCRFQVSGSRVPPSQRPRRGCGLGLRGLGWDTAMSCLLPDLDPGPVPCLSLQTNAL